MLHQNKFKGVVHDRPRDESILESQIPDFFDLVVWGNEHECIPQVRECLETKVHFLQPGSTVVTSYAESEAKPKHCFVLKVKRDGAFTVKPLRLRCVRRFLFKDVALKASGLAPN